MFVPQPPTGDDLSFFLLSPAPVKRAPGAGHVRPGLVPNVPNGRGPVQADLIGFADLAIDPQPWP